MIKPVMALSLIQMIRTVHNCNLPIEVILLFTTEHKIFYMGEQDLSKKSRDLLNQIDGVSTRDIQLIFDPDLIDIWGFAIKPFALLASSFQKAMLIDADVVFLQSPSRLFDSKLFSQTGALFFQDRTLPQSLEVSESLDLIVKHFFDLER
jgi:hypothetical protein